MQPLAGRPTAAAAAEPLNDHACSETRDSSLIERRGSVQIRVVPNVHKDDIHCLNSLSDETFVTGSKDGSLKKWGLDGSRRKTLYDPKEIRYENWITATATLNDRYWISGTRNGEVHFWDNAGEFCQPLEAWPVHCSESRAKCKERNAYRIHCLATFEKEANKPFFFTGWATQFTLNSYVGPPNINHTLTSSNDWVYAIQPIHEKALLVVTGCRLDVWEQRAPSSDWCLKSKLIAENRTINPRPYISAITPLQDNPSQYALAVFDGSARVIDIEAQKILFHAREHEGRVWTIENISQSVFTSCGDEGTVKGWDTRLPPRSIFSVKDNEKTKARVSVLKLVQSNELLSGSCPDNVRNGETARFTFRDIRHL